MSGLTNLFANTNYNRVNGGSSYYGTPAPAPAPASNNSLGKQGSTTAPGPSNQRPGGIWGTVADVVGRVTHTPTTQTPTRNGKQGSTSAPPAAPTTPTSITSTRPQVQPHTDPGRPLPVYTGQNSAPWGQPQAPRFQTGLNQPQMGMGGKQGSSQPPQPQYGYGGGYNSGPQVSPMRPYGQPQMGGKQGQSQAPAPYYGGRFNGGAAGYDY